MDQCLFCKCDQSQPSYYPAFQFNGKEFNYITCSQCRLVYISPLLDASDLGKLYSLDYHDEFYFNSQKKYSEQLALVQQHKPSGKLLDYGCGDASFLNYFKNQGYTLYGAEYNPSLVLKLNDTHQDISFITIQHLMERSLEKYDIIHLGDVLEHLINPREVIETLSAKLTPGGILFVEGPIEHNFHLAYPTRSIYFNVRKMLQPARKVSMRPFHVFFANRENQRKFFEDLKLNTLHYQVFEWAWPYPSEWKKSTSLKLKAEYLIGQVSLAASRIVKGWGNRFYYFGTPRLNK